MPAGEGDAAKLFKAPRWAKIAVAAISALVGAAAVVQAVLAALK